MKECFFLNLCPLHGSCLGSGFDLHGNLFVSHLNTVPKPLQILMLILNAHSIQQLVSIYIKALKYTWNALFDNFTE